MNDKNGPLIAAVDLASGSTGSSPASGSSDERASMWYHLDRTHEGAATWLRANAKLDETVLSELLVESTRPRASMIDNGLLLTLRGVNLNPGSDPEDMVSLRVWADAERILSVQGRPLQATAALIQQCRDGKGPRSIEQLLVALVSGLADRMAPVIGQINESIDDLESRVIEPHEVVDRAELAVMRQRIITLHRYLEPQADALRQLLETKGVIVETENRRRLKQTINSMTRFVEDLQAARGQTAVIQDELSNQLSETTNQRMYLLTIIAAIVLPLSLLTGLLGMNVGGIPGEGYRFGFAVVTIAMAALAVIGYVLVRRSRWL